MRKEDLLENHFKKAVMHWRVFSPNYTPVFRIAVP